MAVAAVLLDTHVLLWALIDPDALSARASAVIRDPGNVLFVSSASAWELSIKHELGRLAGAGEVLAGFTDHLRRLAATPIVITPEHALAAGSLPPHHRDPFDRMLVAQARHEGVPIVTNDVAIGRYDVQTVW